MPRVVSKGSITGRSAFSNGGLGLSIGTRATKGIRHAIGRRAPDSVKINGDPTPDYKIGYNGAGRTYTGTGSVPYVETIAVFENDAENSKYELFENKLQTFSVKFVTDLSGRKINAVFTNGNAGIFAESLFSYKSKNTHEFTFPDISYNFTTADISNNSKTLILENNKLVTGTSTGTNYDVMFMFENINKTADVTLLNNTLIPYIDNKIYTLTMTSNDVIQVSGTGNIKSSVLEYDPV